MSPAAPQRIPYSFARRHGIVVAGLDADGQAELLVRPGLDLAALAEVRRALGTPVRLTVQDEERFAQSLARAYARDDDAAAQLADDMFTELSQDEDLAALAQDLPKVEDLLESEDDAPVIRLINAVFTQAVRDGASDIHLEPFESRAVARFRVDGRLKDVLTLNRALHPALVSRIKIMASLDIAEKRLPQDGRIMLRIAGRPTDVRVSTLPAAHGERVVLRLLDRQAGRLDLAALGMDAATRAAVDELAHRPHGILLVTGPTGSGKTTTLYALLKRLDAASRNIMTVEDPVEYDLEGVAQTQVNSRIDMDFARALRAILRQDPDVVMIGEIRDLETARIAVQASLTGHLVLATLHTNDAASAVTRLVDMGVEPYLLASGLVGVLAQRLVRRLCPQCATERPLPAEERQALGLPEGVTGSRHADGCPACAMSGYRGRTGIYELLVVDEALQGMIHDRAADQALRDHARGRGMRSLREDGGRLVAAGVTSVEEVLGATRE
jgi:general secretion pathway protein E